MSKKFLQLRCKLGEIKAYATFVMKNLIALALLFATAFGVLALGVGAFKASGEDEGKTAIDDLLNSFDNSTTKPTDTTTKPTDTTTSPDVDHPVIVPEKYADNLSGVFIASGVEGLITDRTARSIENRLEKYQKLSGLYVKNSANEGAGVVSVEDAKRILMKEVPERAHTLMAGFALFSVLADKCRASAVTVTDASVRDGYLKERLMKND